MLHLGQIRSGANFMSKKLGVKISPGGISPNFIKKFPLAFLLEDRFLLGLGEIYSLLGMKLAPGNNEGTFFCPSVRVYMF